MLFSIKQQTKLEPEKLHFLQRNADGYTWYPTLLKQCRTGWWKPVEGILCVGRDRYDWRSATCRSWCCRLFVRNSLSTIRDGSSETHISSEAHGLRAPLSKAFPPQSSAGWLAQWLVFAGWWQNTTCYDSFICFSQKKTSLDYLYYHNFQFLKYCRVLYGEAWVHPAIKEGYHCILCCCGKAARICPAVLLCVTDYLLSSEVRSQQVSHSDRLNKMSHSDWLNKTSLPCDVEYYFCGPSFLFLIWVMIIMVGCFMSNRVLSRPETKTVDGAWGEMNFFFSFLSPKIPRVLAFSLTRQCSFCCRRHYFTIHCDVHTRWLL